MGSVSTSLEKCVQGNLSIFMVHVFLERFLKCTDLIDGKEDCVPKGQVKHNFILSV